MPNMDHTGPLGSGPNGCGMGPCGGRQSARRGGRTGRGQGFFRGGIADASGFQVIPSEEEKSLLEKRKSWLETQLTAIVQRLQGLEDNKK